jgi:hypothetical protein
MYPCGEVKACILVRRSKRPMYFPVEVCFSYIIKASSLLKSHQLSQVLVKYLYDQLCKLVPLQRYTKAVYSAMVLTCREIQTEGSHRGENPPAGADSWWLCPSLLPCSGRWWPRDLPALVGGEALRAVTTADLRRRPLIAVYEVTTTTSSVSLPCVRNTIQARR